MATRRPTTTTSRISGVTPDTIHNEVELKPTCCCGLQAPILTAKTRENVGRRFYRCANFNSSPCKFFMWAEPRILDRARDIIIDLLERNHAPSESSQLRCNEVDVSSLIAQINMERAENRRIKRELARVKEGRMLLKLAFVLCMCCLIMMVVLYEKVNPKLLSLP